MTGGADTNAVLDSKSIGQNEFGGMAAGDELTRPDSGTFVPLSLFLLLTPAGLPGGFGGCNG